MNKLTVAPTSQIKKLNVQYEAATQLSIKATQQYTASLHKLRNEQLSVAREVRREFNRKNALPKKPTLGQIARFIPVVGVWVDFGVTDNQGVTLEVWYKIWDGSHWVESSNHKDAVELSKKWRATAETQICVTMPDGRVVKFPKGSYQISKISAE